MAIRLAYMEKINLDNPRLQRVTAHLLKIWEEEFDRDDYYDIDIRIGVERLIEAVTSSLSLYTCYAPPDIQFKWDREDWHKPGELM